MTNKGYVVLPVEESEVKEKADFGSFVLYKTDKEIVYSNYTGYTVVVKPWVTTFNGTTGYQSLYSWLDDVISSYKLYKDNPDGVFVNSEGSFVSASDVELEKYLKAIAEYQKENGKAKADGKYYGDGVKYLYKDNNGIWYPESCVLKNSDFLDYLKIVTEANITRPLVVFCDRDYACNAATEHILWMQKKGKELQSAATSVLAPENHEENAKAFGIAIDNAESERIYDEEHAAGIHQEIE